MESLKTEYADIFDSAADLATIMETKGGEPFHQSTSGKTYYVDIDFASGHVFPYERSSRSGNQMIISLNVDRGATYSEVAAVLRSREFEDLVEAWHDADLGEIEAKRAKIERKIASSH